MFVAHRSALLALVDDPHADSSMEVSWEEWGPASTRWLSTSSISMHSLATTAGQRMATICVDAWRTPAPIRLLDFNPHHVAAQRALGPVTTVCASIRVVEADDGDKDTEGNIPTEVFEMGRVVSKLPYVETVSNEKFSFKTVMMNDENIIGAMVSLLIESLLPFFVDVHLSVQ
jgi:hypothetical protein